MSCKSFRKMTLLFLLLLLGSLGLKDIGIIIPKAVERGKSVTFKCLYHLDKDDLYQVKWYQGKQEFCRYTPMEVPPLRIFPIPGIKIDPKGSDAHLLTINAATRKVEGHYTCEVIADAPSFSKVQSHGFVYVVDVPKTYPELIWKQCQIYRPGMKIIAECISHDSMPPANLSFYINNKPALSQQVRHRVSGNVNGSLWTAYSTLRFVVAKHHIKKFKIKIRCEATIYDTFYKSHEKSADAEIVRTNVAPYTWKLSYIKVCPKHRVPENSASENRKNLWVVWSVALIVYGEQSVEKKY